jgi:hypothetical protein
MQLQYVYETKFPWEPDAGVFAGSETSALGMTTELVAVRDGQIADALLDAASCARKTGSAPPQRKCSRRSTKLPDEDADSGPDIRCGKRLIKEWGRRPLSYALA